jgi:Fanconi anemia group M protein
MIEYVEDDYIAEGKIESKPYQLKLVKEVGFNSGIILMPTGSGKTIVLLLLIIKYFKNDYKKQLIVVPKIILLEQHYSFLLKTLKNIKIFLVRADDPHRLSFLQYDRVIVLSTPHIMYNEYEKIKNFFSVLFIDEVHNIYDKYPYDLIMHIQPILGFTASLGSITNGKKKLKLIKGRTIYTVNPEDYVITLEEEYIKLKLSPYIQLLYNEFTKYILQYKRNILTTYPSFKYTSFINLYKKITPIREINYALYNLCLKVIRLQYLSAILGSQHIDLVKDYISKKTITSFVTKTDANKLNMLYNSINSIESFDPKLEAIVKVLKENIFEVAIIFTKYKKMAQIIYEYLINLKYRTKVLSGQSKNIKRNDQTKLIEELKRKEFNILISTPVGYEGLDIPSANLVIAYEITASIIQYVQQKGRTARAGIAGKVVYLMNEGTLDEINYKKLIGG